MILGGFGIQSSNFRWFLERYKKKHKQTHSGMSHQTKHATSRTNGNCEQLKWETRAEAKQEKLAFEASTTKAVYVCVQLNTILCI